VHPTRDDDALPADLAETAAGYGIDPEVQLALSQLRTDLD